MSRTIGVASAIGILALGLIAVTPAGASQATPNAPLVIPELVRSASPGSGDITGDGVDDLVIASQSGTVRAYKSGNLNDLLWAVSAVPYVPAYCNAQSTPTAIESSPVIADVDADGSNDIIIGMGSTYAPNQNGGLQVLNANGTVKWNWTTSNDIFNVWNAAAGAGADGWCEGVFASAAVGDVNGDGYPDVVFGGWDDLVHALDGRTGVELPGFPFDNVDTIWSSPALYDVDGDGRDEIFTGGDDTPGRPGAAIGGQIHALDWDQGQVSVMWKRHPDETAMGSVAIGDINGDGRPEMVITNGLFYNNADTRKVQAFHLDDGSDVPGWPVQLEGVVTASVALGDVNGDNQLDVVVGDWNSNVYALDGSGSQLWKTAICCNPAAASLNAIKAGAIIGDLDGDGDNDVAVGSGWSMQILNGKTGVRMQELAIGFSYDSSPILGDFGSRGRRLYMVGFDLINNRSQVSDVSVDSTARIPWPSFRGAGNGLPTEVPCAGPATPTGGGAALTGDGYWLIDSGGTVYEFGDAANYGSANSRIAGTGAQAVDIEPTKTGRGYWVLDTRGCVHNFGDADFYGNLSPGVLGAGERVASLSSISGGYLLFTSRGRVVAFGAAKTYGNALNLILNGPILGSVSMPDGKGYYMVASDGGVFVYGNGKFLGSMGGQQLNQPVMDVVPTADNLGYWQVASDGGIFAFGAAPYRGSIPQVLDPGQQLNKPIVGMVRYGNGYLMVGSDGGIFVFSDKKFGGSLGDTPPSMPIVSVAAMN